LREDAPAEAASRPLAGLSAWLITDGKASLHIQVAGVAQALGLKSEAKRVAPRAPWKYLAPWGPPDPQDRVGKPGSRFGPPWPDFVLATGRQAIPYSSAIRRLAGPATYTIVIQDPGFGARHADFFAVPGHDRLRGANVLAALTAPHEFSPARLAALRASLPADIAALPRPLVAVLLGGPNGVYRYSDTSLDYLAGALASLKHLGAGFLITPSRRTPPELVQALARVTEGAPRILWDGTGANPYPAFLAHADAFIVTADSVNMSGEAAATGRPVYIFEGDGGRGKFARFHEALRRYGASRPLPATFDRLESWDYAPLDSASLIAREIERRWLERKRQAD
jgi:mitochondrial fission protein ELM1